MKKSLIKKIREGFAKTGPIILFSILFSLPSIYVWADPATVDQLVNMVSGRDHAGFSAKIEEMVRGNKFLSAPELLSVLNAIEQTKENTGLLHSFIGLIQDNHKRYMVHRFVTSKGMIMEGGLYLLLEELKKAGKIKSDAKYLVTGSIRMTLNRIMEYKKPIKVPVFYFNESAHLSLMYIMKGPDRCEAFLIDSTDYEPYKQTFAAIATQDLAKCQVTALNLSRQKDFTSCAAFCLNDYLSISESEAQNDSFFDFARKHGRFPTTDQSQSLSCSTNIKTLEILPLYMILGIQSYRAINYYLSEYEKLEGLSSAQRSMIDTFKSKLAKHATESKHVKSECLDHCHAEPVSEQPELAEVIRNNYTLHKKNQYIFIILKALLAMRIPEIVKMANQIERDDFESPVDLEQFSSE